MSDKINGRTLEEIQKGLECCKPVWADNHWKTCDTKCPYIDDVGGFCRAQLMANALALIQQLERERDAAVAEIESLNAEIDAINEDFLRGIHTGREDAQPKWISVEERLPGDPLDGIGDVVELLIDKGDVKEVLPGYYDHDEKDWVIYFGDPSGLYLSKYFSWWRVIKWRSLPEAPKEE